MPAIILTFLTPLLKVLKPIWPYLAAAAVLIAGYLYVEHLRSSLASATAANAALTQTNQANAAAIASYQAQEQKYNAALDTLDAQNRTTSAATGQILGDIAAQPASANAPVAPVLAGALADIAKLQGQSQ
jgi:hypothetical protein